MSTILPTQQLPASSTVAGTESNDTTSRLQVSPQTLVGVQPSANAGSLQDLYGTSAPNGTGERGSTLSSLPPVPGMLRPADYRQTLQEAQNKLGSFLVTGNQSNADAAALAVVQNGGSIRADASQQKAQTAEDKQKTIIDQAQSLTDSAQVSHKSGSHTKFDNHDKLMSKLRAVGMDEKQAKTTLRMLEDGDVSAEAKFKISYELASLGVTGPGKDNVAPIADNASSVLAGLKNLANKEGEKFSKFDTSSGATAAMFITPIGAIAHAVATKQAKAVAMHGVDANLSMLAGARTYDDVSLKDSQAVQTVQDQTLRPSLAQTQQAL